METTQTVQTQKQTQKQKQTYSSQFLRIRLHIRLTSLNSPHQFEEMAKAIDRTLGCEYKFKETSNEVVEIIFSDERKRVGKRTYAINVYCQLLKSVTHIPHNALFFSLDFGGYHRGKCSFMSSFKTWSSLLNQSSNVLSKRTSMETKDGEVKWLLVSSLDEQIDFLRTKNIYLKDENKSLRFEKRMLLKANSELMMQVQKFESNDEIPNFLLVSPCSEGLDFSSDHFESGSLYQEECDKEETAREIQELESFKDFE